MEHWNNRQAEAFRLVMMYGSITKAAEIMEITQPAVSRMIMALTEAVGFPLFKRRSGGLVPTDDAQLLLIEVDRMFAGIDELQRRAEAIRNRELGKVRISAMAHYANELLPPIVAEFCNAFPRIAVTLEVQPRVNIGDSLVSGRSDIGITSLPARTADLTVHKLVSRPAVIIMPATSPLATKSLVDAADVAGERYINFEAGTPFRYEVDAAFERLNIRRDVVIEATTQESICSLVAAGAGVAVVSPFSSTIYSNPKIAVRQFVPAVTVEIGMLVATDRISTAARSFRDFIMEHFRRLAQDNRYLA
jgi:DNA-binding transcriptional LysR family regulator